MNATTQTITARIYERCRHKACLVVPVPADPLDLFPGCFCATTVVLCQACRDEDQARQDAWADREEAAREDRAEEAEELAAWVSEFGSYQDIYGDPDRHA